MAHGRRLVRDVTAQLFYPIDLLVKYLLRLKNKRFLTFFLGASFSAVTFALLFISISDGEKNDSY